MAELEVAKHGKNVVNMAVNKQHGLAHRLKEIALEIAIIVFAVSISIWFHSMSEHRHEQQQVKAFLLGLKADLKRDVKNLEFVSGAYHDADATYQYLAALDPKVAPDAEKFDKEFDKADANRFFTPVTSRFDGFRTGGKLTNIEDEELLNNILTLYQYAHPAIRSSEAGWSMNQTKLREYFDAALEQGDSREQRYRAVASVAGKRRLRKMVAYPQLYERYAETVKLSNAIIQRIDVLYKNAE
jgi:hypothetical protein